MHKLLPNYCLPFFTIFLVPCLLFVSSTDVLAGFFEMPEITEMPQLERKSLLKDLDIPGVRDRDPDPNSGPRLNITKFKLEGIVEFPELGITRADIEGLIEQIRVDLMEEFKVLESGFTEAEIEEVTELLTEIEDETLDRHVTELEVQKLVWLVREQRSRRGVTLGQIETVADRITQFYRERGFILAKAYIPQQEVRDGIVTLTLLLGTLGEVEVLDSGLYREETLAAVFDNMLGEPVTNAVVEENLYLINDFPGVATTGFFQPGSQVGDTKLNINVESENTYDANIRLDNHGSEQTGENRLYAELFWQNPLSNADQLQVAALYAFNPDNTTYYQLRYSTRLFSPRFNIGFGESNNEFVLGPGNSETINNLGIFGETIQSDITATYSFKRSRATSYSTDLIYDNIESQTRLGAVGGADDTSLDDIVSNLTLKFRFDVLDEEDKILHQGDIGLTSGQFDKGADPGQDENYDILEFNYSLLTFWKIPYFESNSRIIYRYSMQYASSGLSSINQFALAGPSRVRGYETNQYSADNAVYTAVDWVFDSPQIFDVSIGDSNLRKMLKPFLFLDLAWGEVVALVDDADNETGQLIGAGFGFQFAPNNQIYANLQIAFPVEEKFSVPDITVPDDDFKLVFDLQYSF